MILKDIIDHIIRTKNARPTPADVVKTAATKYGIILSYMAAYRALTHESCIEKYSIIKNFEMVIPFLEKMKGCNPGSVIGFSRDSDMRLVDLHVFPGMMNWALKFVRPVVSLDAAHLRSEHRGTLYVASVLTGCNDIFPIGFMISAGNEDGETWKKMLHLLKEAYPIIDDQGYGDSGSDGIVRPPFLSFQIEIKG